VFRILWEYFVTIPCGSPNAKRSSFNYLVDSRGVTALENLTFLCELAPKASEFLDRHLASYRPWYPHELEPWTLGRDFGASNSWDSNDFPLPDGVRSSLLVNVLTEDNLPQYYATISQLFGYDGPWGDWGRQWAAEESRHSDALRTYLLLSRAIDPWKLEDMRMESMVASRLASTRPEIYDGLVYLSIQELATRIAHRNTGKLLVDTGADHPAVRSGYEIMARISTDENYHYLFYRDLVKAGFEINASQIILAIEKQLSTFEMPGTDIQNFGHHAAVIASTGIYNLDLHYEQNLKPLILSHWKIEHVVDLSDEAKLSRDRILRRLTRLGALLAASRNRMLS
jgi:acyl-[acyl-carrier-protein] desaturase